MAASLSADMEVAEDFGRRLRSSQSEVRQGKIALDGHCQTLTTFCQELKSKIAETQAQNARARAILPTADAITQGQNIHRTNNIVEEQLLKTQAEDYALEDAAYSLQKGLEAGHVNLDVCLKVLYEFHFCSKFAPLFLLSK